MTVHKNAGPAAGRAAAWPADTSTQPSINEREFIALAQSYYRHHGAAAAHALLAGIERMVTDMVPR